MVKVAARLAAKDVPKWIWHPALKEQLVWNATKRFELSEEETGLSFFLAATGRVEVELNGEQVGTVEEHPSAVADFARLPGFPSRLSPGVHVLTLRIYCTATMPIVPINIHLSDRAVGCIAFLQGENWVITTDETWTADGERAKVVCLLGEEPYGDLGNGPEWFASGGYGDIAVRPIESVAIIESSRLDVQLNSSFRAATGASLRVSGTAFGTWASADWRAKEYYKFYHLRKQWEWRDCRRMQRETDVTEIPRATFDLGMEYNARLRVADKCGQAVTVLWNGAESLHELEHYDGCITEWFQVGAFGAEVTLPQGMRYVRLYVFAPPGARFELELDFESASVPLTQIGAAVSDFPLFNDIFSISAHTNRVCHQVGLWDGIKRDRLNWVYDFYMAAKGSYALWNDFAVLKRTIRELGDGTPYGYWMNDIPAYTMWWFHQIWEYYWQTGDLGFVMEMKDAILRHSTWLNDAIDQETGLPRKDEFSFLDWSPMTHDEYRRGLSGLIRFTSDVVERLRSEAPGLEIAWNRKIEPLPENAFFTGSISLITPLLGILSGSVTPARAASFLRSYRSSDPITPLSAYWYAECCSRFGMHEEAWEAIAAIWGKMLEEGSTTTWESSVLRGFSDFHANQTTYRAYGSYRMSLCHSWSSTPAYWISRYVLGVQPIEPGFRAIRFQPYLPEGMNRCDGTVPTPHGPIHVRLTREPGGGTNARIHCPATIRRAEEGTSCYRFGF